MSPRTLLAALVLVLPATGYAQVQTSITTTRPTFVATVAHEEPDSNGWQWRWAAEGDRRDIGQTFLAPENFTLHQIAVQVHAGAAAAVSKAPFHLRLNRYADTHATKPTAPLGSWSGTLPANENGLAYGQGSWITFTVPDTKLEKDQAYGFTLQFDAPGPSGQGIVFSVPQHDTFLDGIGLFSTDGISWQQNSDLNFLLIAAGAPIQPHIGRVLTVNQTGAGEFKTLDAAARVAQAGDTIQVAPNTGPYREILFIPASGSPESPIIFDGGGNVITGFEPLTGWTEDNGTQSVHLPTFPCVLTYKGERLRQDPAGQFNRYATINAAKDTLTLLPGTETEGWEISRRPFAVRVFNASYQTYRNVRASGSSNDGFNIHGTGTGLIFENVEGFQNLDEGFSSHDQTRCTIKNGKFWDNDNGVGNVTQLETIAENVDTWNNLGYGFWLNDGAGTMTNIRSWGNGVCQVNFYNVRGRVDNVIAYKPAFTTKPWTSYQESTNSPLQTPYFTRASEITGQVTVNPAAAP
jgi:hypothetical protein